MLLEVNYELKHLYWTFIFIPFSIVLNRQHKRQFPLIYDSLLDINNSVKGKRKLSLYDI